MTNVLQLMEYNNYIWIKTDIEVTIYLEWYM